MTIWNAIRHLFGWDNPNSFGYLFHSGSGGQIELIVWGSVLYFWRSSCQASRRCLRHGSHSIIDPQSGVTHKMCWRHAGLPHKYGLERIKEIQARHKILYLGSKPGRG